MSNNNPSNNTASNDYFDLHTEGVGYLYGARDVKPGTERKFKPFVAVRIAALHGKADEVNKTYFDTTVFNADAKAVISQYMEQINDGKMAADGSWVSTKVLAGFRIGDLTPKLFTHTKGEKAGETGISLKARLIYLKWLKINGETVYTAPVREDEESTDGDTPETDSSSAPQTPADDTPVADGQSTGTAAEMGNDSDKELVCPFDDLPGDTVALKRDEPGFEEKKTWLKANGYGWDSSSKAWVLKQEA